MDINWTEGFPTDEGTYLVDCGEYQMISDWDGYDFTSLGYSDISKRWARIS